MVLENLAIALIACVFLVKSAETLVGALSKIAAYFNVTEFVIGFILIAFATSIPELTIGLSSALKSTLDEPMTALAIGNVIGANIIDLTLVIGIATLLKRDIKIETKAVRTDTIYMFLIAALPIILMMDKEISQNDGFVLLFVFTIYIIRLLSQKKRFREKQKIKVTKKELNKSLILLGISLIVLFASAFAIIENVSAIATALGVPLFIISLFGISLGTTLPELTFETKAILSEHQYMALGDLIGSVIANSTLVLGITAIISPIPVGGYLIYLLFSAFFMLTVAFLFMTFIEAERHIIWQEGLGLILLYVLFMIVLFNIRHFEVTQLM